MQGKSILTLLQNKYAVRNFQGKTIAESLAVEPEKGL